MTVPSLITDEFEILGRSLHRPLEQTTKVVCMFRDTKAFSSFSVDNLQRAKEFYGQTLGLEVVETPEGLELHIAGSTPVFVYPSDNYTAPKHTVLNFPVEDIDAAMDELAARGVRMEHYDLPDLNTDERGIFRGDSGPSAIAWFKDPAGHVLSVLQTE